MTVAYYSNQQPSGSNCVDHALRQGDNIMRNMTRPWTHSRVGRRFIGLAFVATLLAVLAGCSLGGSSTPSGSDQLALTQVPWCDVPPSTLWIAAAPRRPPSPIGT